MNTSSWVHQMRRKADRLVRASNEQERTALRDYEQRISELAINDEIWQSACELTDSRRKAGRRVPANDLLITACARHHDVELEASDAHFGFLKRL